MDFYSLSDKAIEAELGRRLKSLRLAIGWLLLVLALAVVLTAVAVTYAGPIGFVGLVTPHIIRLMAGSGHRLLLPSTALLGGSLLIGADLLSRTLIAPRMMPVGVFTTLLGVPLFLYLIRRQS